MPCKQLHIFFLVYTQNKQKPDFKFSMYIFCNIIIFQINMYYWDMNSQTWFTISQMYPTLCQSQQFYSSNSHIPEFYPSFLPASPPAFQQQQRIYQGDHQRTETKSPVLPKKRKIIEKTQGEPVKVSRNIKSLIIKQFVKSLKKDASKMLELKERLGISYPIKNFIEKMCKKLPASKEKYIKVKTIQELCFQGESQQFSKIMRILLKNFLKTDFEINVLNKKKNKEQYLKGSRQLYARVFEAKKCLEKFQDNKINPY